MISLQHIDQLCMSLRMADYWRRATGCTAHVDNIIVQRVDRLSTMHEIAIATGRKPVRTRDASTVIYSGIKFICYEGRS